MPGEHQARENDARPGPLRRLLVAVVVVSLTIPLAGAAIGGGAVGPFVGDAAARPDPAVDVVFVFDRSGSMDENRYELAREMDAVDARLDAAGADARYALLTYAGSVRTEQGWTSEYADVDRALDFRTAGSTENASDAVLAATSMDFRDGADRVVVLVTDEDDDSPAPRRGAAVASLSGFRFVVVSPSGPEVSACAVHSPPCDSEPTNELRSVAEDADGAWIDVAGEAEAIVEEVGTEVAPAPRRPTPATPAPVNDDDDDDDERADIAIRDATVTPGTVEIGEPVEVAVTLENTGEDSGGFQATLASTRERLGSRSVHVPAGETRTVRFVATFPEPAGYDLFVSHRRVGRVEVTPLRPTVVRTAVRRDGRTLLANVSDARANDTVAVPLAGLDVPVDEGGSLANFTVTPATAADFQLRLVAVEEPRNGTVELPDGVRPLAYLVVEAGLEEDDVKSVGVEYRSLPAGAALYRYDENGSAWERLEATAVGDADGAPLAVRTRWSSLFAIGHRGPAFEVTGVEVDAGPVVVGDTVRATVTVENAGPVEGSYRVEVRVDGTAVAMAAVSVQPGRTRRATVTFTPRAPGTYRVVTGDGEGRAIRVRPLPTQTPSLTTTSATTTSPGQAGFGLAVATAAVALLALAARRRR